LLGLVGGGWKLNGLKVVVGGLDALVPDAGVRAASASGIVKLNGVAAAVAAPEAGV
jgi:hypothetical protein